MVAGLLSIGLGHVFAGLGLAVIAGSFFVIDAGIGIDPDLTASGGRRRLACVGFRGGSAAGFGWFRGGC